MTLAYATCYNAYIPRSSVVRSLKSGLTNSTVRRTTETLNLSTGSLKPVFEDDVVERLPFDSLIQSQWEKSWRIAKFRVQPGADSFRTLTIYWILTYVQANESWLLTKGAAAWSHPHPLSSTSDIFCTSTYIVVCTPKHLSGETSGGVSCLNNISPKAQKLLPQTTDI